MTVIAQNVHVVFYVANFHPNFHDGLMRFRVKLWTFRVSVHQDGIAVTLCVVKQSDHFLPFKCNEQNWSLKRGATCNWSITEIGHLAFYD